MTRMFTGGRGGSGDGGNPLFSKYKKRSAKDTFMKQQKGIDDSNLTPQEKYQKNLDSKMNDLRNQALLGGSKFKMSLPGTEGGEERKLSKSAEAFIRALAEKKMREEQKKEKERASIKVTPKSFTGMVGGRIDGKGRIFGPDGKKIGQINLKTGKATNNWGTMICKYDPKSPYAEYKIASFIAHEYRANKGTLYGTAPAGGAKGGMGNFYGGGSSGGGMGSFYGNSDGGSGGFWG
jgi:hypothetical protein